MTTATLEPVQVDYLELMKQVEAMVDAIGRRDEAPATILTVAREIVRRFHGELGISGGRIYAREGDGYVLRHTFGEAKPVPAGLRVPASYPPIEELLERGVVFMDAGDEGTDRELERELGVEEFAGVEADGGAFLLAFDVALGHERDDVLFSLGILRHAINQKLRQQRMEDVFRQARQIQLSILPRRAPRFGDYSLAARNDYLESVGGDFFDYIPISDKLLGVAIADVSGHGLPAALQVRDIYVGLRMGLARELKMVRTVERLNRIIHESALTSRFVSLFYCELEPNGVVIYVNAGHPPSLHLSREGEVKWLDQGGPVLGPLPDATYDRGFVELEPGDLLVLYTDGITEAPEGGRRGEGEPEEFGTERLIAVARRHLAGSASEVVDGVFAALEEWTAGGPAEDDRTLVAIKMATRMSNVE